MVQHGCPFIGSIVQQSRTNEIPYKPRSHDIPSQGKHQVQSEQAAQGKHHV